MALSNQRGTTLVEATLSLPVFILIVGLTFTTVYLCVAQSWLNDSAEEAALCVAEKMSTHFCKAELRKKTEMTLPFGEYKRLSVLHYDSKIVVSYEFRAFNIRLSNENSLQLPIALRTR